MDRYIPYIKIAVCTQNPGVNDTIREYAAGFEVRAGVKIQVDIMKNCYPLAKKILDREHYDVICLGRKLWDIDSYTFMICDSDSNRIIDLENKLEEIGELEHIKINIETRHELELQTIENWLPETYDILFINLDRETHQELTRAGKIREKDEKIHMILTSENQENIQETFDLMPAVYLITPLEKESLRHWIQTIQKRVKDRRLYITFNYKRKTYHIPYREILYLESQQHKIRVVTAKESYTFYGQLSRIQKQMQQGRETFLRIHQSYLVNSRYVYWMDRNTVRTQDGRRFSVSSSYREQAREKYLGYVKQI